MNLQQDIKKQKNKKIWKKLGLGKSSKGVPKTAIGYSIEEFILNNPDKYQIIGGKNAGAEVRDSHETTTKAKGQGL